MTPQSRSNHNIADDHSIHFGQIAGDGYYEGHPLLTEYRLLYEEYTRLRRRCGVLEKEKADLTTQLTEMGRSLDLAGRIDPMTGLANRRDVMEKLDREFSRAERHHRTFSLMLADLDNFRRVNDHYGYNAGDDVLVEVARVLMGCIRSEDVCARWGGQEFLFLLTETALDGALELARKVNQSISMTEFKAQKPGIRITASLGVCEYKPGRTLQDCITLADQALRTAKQDGKDRCVVA